MRRFLLDTGIAACYIDRRRGGFERARAEAASGNVVGITIPVLGELWYRLEGSVQRDRNHQRLLVALASWKLWPTTKQAAFEYGRIAFELRRVGRPIGQNDTMIAAVALTLPRCTVVTMDAGLSSVPGLSVENWAT